MRFMLMCCFDERKWNGLPERKRGEIMRRYGELMQGLESSGQHLASGQLQPTAAAFTIRDDGGTPTVTDGPFAETKEQLGGYHLLECSSLDEALAIAKRIPTIPFGGVVEVRALLSP